MSRAKKLKEEAARKRWEALVMAALTAVGMGLGEGIVKAIPEILPHDITPRVEEPLHPRDNELERWKLAPDGNVPSGGEPKQRLRVTLTDNEGKEHSWFQEASLARTALISYNVATLQPEGDDRLVIDAQLHPSSPAFVFKVGKQSIVDHIAMLGDPSLSATDLEFVKQITITPEQNPNKPAES